MLVWRKCVTLVTLYSRGVCWLLLLRITHISLLTTTAIVIFLFSCTYYHISIHKAHVWRRENHPIRKNMKCFSGKSRLLPFKRQSGVKVELFPSEGHPLLKSLLHKNALEQKRWRGFSLKMRWVGAGKHIVAGKRGLCRRRCPSLPLWHSRCLSDSVRICFSWKGTTAHLGSPAGGLYDSEWREGDGFGWV